jgi:hypothetical protein
VTRVIHLCEVSELCTQVATWRCRLITHGMEWNPVLACDRHKRMLEAEAVARGHRFEYTRFQVPTEGEN